MARERHSSWRQISFLRAMGKLRMSAIGRGQKGRFGGHKHKEFGKGWRELAKEDLNNRQAESRAPPAPADARPPAAEAPPDPGQTYQSAVVWVQKQRLAFLVASSHR